MEKENNPLLFHGSAVQPPASSLSLNMATTHDHDHAIGINAYTNRSIQNGFQTQIHFPAAQVKDDDVSSNRNLAVPAEGYKNSGGKRKGEKKIWNPRFAFQTRSQVDILDDGYRWRKYGQKAVKNNKFPRSYYRCTHEGCNVKKQVQRLSRDEGIVVTTYEGMHLHPIHKPTDNFEQILNQMNIYPPPSLI